MNSLRPMTYRGLLRPAFRLFLAAPALFLAATVAHGAATYTTEDNGATLVVMVDADGATLDASQVTSSITNIAKRGTGTLVASPLTSYEGEFSLEGGIFKAKNNGDLGKKNFANRIYVKDGASIVFACTTASLFDYKELVFSGQPAPEGVSGANNVAGKLTFDPQVSGWVVPKIGSNMKFTLQDDAAFVKVSGGRLVLGGTFDLGGHVLTLDGKSAQIDVGGTFSNGGGVVVNNTTTWMTESYTLTFDAASAGTGYVEVRSGAVLNLKNYIHAANGWRLYNKGGTLTANTTNRDCPPSEMAYSAWDGPVDFQNTCNVSTYTGDATHQNRGIFNIKGAISGSGKINVGPSWLNVFSQENTYSGAVTVKADSSFFSRVGGIGVWNGAACFPNASSITFTDHARFAFMDIVPANVPRLTFNSDVDQSIGGGLYTSRSSMAGITKTGEGVLSVNSPVHVTGKAVVSNGTLRVASSIPGLFEYHILPKAGSADQNYIFYSGEAYGFCKPWKDNYLQHINIITNGVNEDCAAKTYNASASSGWGEGCTVRNGWWYHGYIWNRTGAPATWKIWCGLTTGAAIWLGADRSTLIEFRGHTGKPAYVQDVTFPSGATPIDIFVWGNNDSLWGHVFNLGSSQKRYGLVFSTGETSFTTAEFNALIDELPTYQYKANSFQDSNGSTFIADFVVKANEFVNLGTGASGEFFTATYGQDPDADLATLVAQLPVFDDMAFPSGATLDLDDNRAFPVGNLTGSPAVENAGVFGITNCWTLLAADFPKANASVRHPMTVDGALAFPQGATFSIDNPMAMAREETIVATTTGGITGAPVPASDCKDWRLKVAGNNLILKKVDYSVLIFR